eukprot:COSAG01_NODE_313_length_19043_cov_3.917177_18_plen_260_part_00
MSQMLETYLACDSHQWRENLSFSFQDQFSPRPHKMAKIGPFKVAPLIISETLTSTISIKQNDATRAIKAIPITSDTSITMIATEFNIMNNSEAFVDAYQLDVTDTHGCIEMQYANQGALSKGNFRSSKKKYAILQQLDTLMAELTNCYHCDINSDNIVMINDHTLKFIDAGESVFKNKKETDNQKNYAKACLKNEDDYDTRNDNIAIALVKLSILSGISCHVLLGKNEAEKAIKDLASCPATLKAHLIQISNALNISID